MAVTCEIKNGAGVATLHGSLTASNADNFRAQFCAWLETAPDVRHVVMDMGAVTFMDSTGLGMLIACLKRVAERGGDIRIARAQTAVKLVLDITRANKIFQIFGTLEDALQSCR